MDKKAQLQKVSVYEAVDKAGELAKMISCSNIFGVKNAKDAAVIAITCLVENITPLDFIRTYHIIDGMPAMRSDAMLAEFCRNGGKHNILEYSENRCKIEFHWKGQRIVWEWTIEDARRAGLLKGHNWQKYPKDMLFARCVSSGLKKIAPELFHGLYVPEEIQDIQNEKVPQYQVKDVKKTNENIGKLNKEELAKKTEDIKKELEKEFGSDEEEFNEFDNPSIQNKQEAEEYKKARFDYSVTPSFSQKFDPGTPWVDLPRNQLFKAKAYFEKGALPVKLSKEERQGFVKAIEKAIDERTELKEAEKQKDFEESLDEATLGELERMVKDARYGEDKKRTIIIKFLRRLLTDLPSFDNQTRKHYMIIMGNIDKSILSSVHQTLYDDVFFKLAIK